MRKGVKIDIQLKKLKYFLIIYETHNYLQSILQSYIF